MTLIDVHTHLGQFAAARQSADGGRLSTMLCQAGITRAIAFSAEACYGGIELGNRYTFQQVSNFDMLAMLLVLHPTILKPRCGCSRSSPKTQGYWGETPPPPWELPHTR